MLKNHLKIAWRNLFRRKLAGILYISGLGIALLCVIYMGIYIHDETSFDTILPESELIYRVNIDGKMGPEEFLSGNTPPPVGQALMDNFPEVTAYTRLYLNSPEFVSCQEGSDNKIFKENRMFSVDPNFLDFFKFHTLEGNASTSLHHPYSVVLTKSTAKKYFGEQSALGKQLQFDEWSMPFMVTAVLEDLPSTSSLQFDILIPNAANPMVQYFDWSWIWLQMNTFIKLAPESANPVSVAQIEDKLPAMVKVMVANAFERVGKPFDKFIANGGRWNLLLQPLHDIHLGSAEIYSNQIAHGNATTVNAFIFIALLILSMACINCMNLSTAQALRRSKEVGVKKVLGSGRKHLIGQFLTESFLFSLMAMVLALILMVLLLPYFNQLTGKTFVVGELVTGSFVLSLFTLVMITSLFSGLYPALYQSGFRAVSNLKNNVNPNSIFSELATRNGLVIFQFMVSSALIISSIIIFKQIQYINEVDLGFDKEQILVLNQVEKVEGSQAALVDEFRAISEVIEASLSTGVPSKNPFGDYYVPIASETGGDLVPDIALASYMADDNFVPTIGMNVLYGRNFSMDHNDSTSVILNETAVKQIGWDPEKVVGNRIQYPGNRNQTFEVIGVVKDFNIESLHTKIIPFALFHFSSKTYYPRQLYISLRLEKGKIPQGLKAIEDKWTNLVPGQPYQVTFLDEEIEQIYQADQKTGYTFWVFTLLAVMVGCIGLFGLVMASVEKRVQEIGVRKVLGASMFEIVRLLSKDYIKLVMIAAILATPIAWWAMDFWLKQFAYKIDIHVGYFMLAFLVAILFSFPTILFQTGKAAISSPVKSLKSE